jgi:hypothetical protein
VSKRARGHDEGGDGDDGGRRVQPRLGSPAVSLAGRSAEFFAQFRHLEAVLARVCPSPVLHFPPCGQRGDVAPMRKFKAGRGARSAVVEMDFQWFCAGLNRAMGSVAELVVLSVQGLPESAVVFLRLSVSKWSKNDARTVVKVVPLPGQEVPEGFFQRVGLRASFADLVGVAHDELERELQAAADAAFAEPPAHRRPAPVAAPAPPPRMDVGVDVDVDVDDSVLLRDAMPAQVFEDDEPLEPLLLPAPAGAMLDVSFHDHDFGHDQQEFGQDQPFDPMSFLSFDDCDDE